MGEQFNKSVSLQLVCVICRTVLNQYVLSQVVISPWKTASCCVLMFTRITIICLPVKLVSKQPGKLKNKALQDLCSGDCDSSCSWPSTSAAITATPAENQLIERSFVPLRVG